MIMRRRSMKRKSRRKMEEKEDEKKRYLSKIGKKLVSYMGYGIKLVSHEK